MTTALLVRMPNELREAVRVRAEQDDLSMAQLVRRAIGAYLRMEQVGWLAHPDGWALMHQPADEGGSPVPVFVIREELRGVVQP